MIRHPDATLPPRLLRPMQPVSLEIGSDGDAAVYPSLVLDLTEGRELVVGAPLDRGEVVRLERDTPVRVQITRPDGLHVLASRVLARSTGPGAYLRLAWPDAPERIERRYHPRVEVRLACDVLVRDADTGADRRLAPAETLDLSASGVRLALPEPLAADTQARITLPLPDGATHACEARVVRGGADGAGEGARYWVAFEFQGLLQATRDALAAFVFATLREQRRPGTS